MKRVLVTGGTGFIGAALVKRLVRDGHEVRVLDDNSRGAPRRLEGFLKDVEISLRVTFACVTAALNKALQAGNSCSPSSGVRKRHGKLLQDARARPRDSREGDHQCVDGCLHSARLKNYI